MSHVDDGTLHELVDDELDATARAAAEAHLASCGDCTRRFAEATAMARQVQTLLGTLDVLPAPVRIVAPTPVRPVALATATVTSMQRRIRTLRRVALAASALVVAGISYRVGVSRTTGDVATARESAPAVASSAQQPVLMPSAGVAAAESIERSSAPTVRIAPRVGSSAESEVVAGTASPAVDVVASPLSALLTAPVDAASRVSAEEAAMRPAASTLTGYQAIEEVALPSVTRRRYIAADGTALVLVIAPTTAAEVKPDATAVQEFTVSTAQGRSTVRWQLSGMSYELQGALAPDSLKKLATQLK